MRLHPCPWRNAAAWVMAIVTLGSWIPFANTAQEGTTDEEFDFLAVPPTVGSHDVVPPNAGGKVVDLTKKPKPAVSPTPKAAQTPPTHAQPTPKKKVTPSPVATTASSKIIAFLRAQLGEDYAWGGNGPDDWDCSGLSLAALAQVGVELPRTSELQSLMGKRVSLNELRVGDLLFWGFGPGTAYHVTVYIGNGKFIGAQNPSVGVVERSLMNDMPDFARRVL